MKSTKNLFLLVGLFISFIGLAQIKPEITFKEYTQSGEYIKKGAEYYLDKDYKKAIEQFELIHESDTNYSESLADKAAAYILLEEFEKAEKVALEGLKGAYDDRHLHYRNLASSLDKQEKYDEAIATLDKGLKEFPFNMHMLYSKVIYLDDAQKDEECADLLKNQLREHYFYPNFHLKAGLLSYNEKQISKTLMAYGVYLILNPGKQNANQILYYLNKVVR